MMFAALMLAALLNPASLVDTFVGTSGTVVGGPIDDFPGADFPFGMLQWSPDTTSKNAGGGYEYTDKAITGFSMTHLSGPGCSVFGDFSMLPTVGAVTDPANASQPFTHTSEVSAPGYYAVTLGNPGIRTELTVTPRTGLGRFTFPRTAQANILFNAASDQAGVSKADVRIVGKSDLEGSATTGNFCGMPDQHRVYFVAHFNRPFAAAGTMHGAGGSASSAWVRFNATTDPVVRVRVALSFVNVPGARANLSGEARSWSIVHVRNAALTAWTKALSRITIAGGTRDEQRQFYTALYHTMLHPNLFSDANGLYRGFDDKIHHVRPGHNEYANYSDWDIYRTEMPLIALLEPARASDMAQSLVDAYTQSGWLPRWALANQPTSVMGGDSVDPVIAGAYAFGGRNFDTTTALAAMVKGASVQGSAYGWYFERPELKDYLARGYIVNTHTTSVSPVPNGASETLEYALDDFSIAAFARAIGNNAVYAQFMRRSGNWSHLFNTATGLIAPRNADGTFEFTTIGENGQSGFQEGNAAQYTWMVPQDLRDLIHGMGGRSAAVARLNTFFSQLNAGQNQPYAWMGNEPSIGSPWVYLSAGEPWRTQQIVRTVMTTLWADSPVGIPGNDDLGTMSAWYVWSAIGLYPQNPALRVLDIGSPLFPHIAIRTPHGPTLVIDAPHASAANAFIQSLRINGRTTQHTWLDLPMHGTTSLAFTLAKIPNRAWGASASDAPPSFAPSRGVAFPPATAARVQITSAPAALSPGASAPLTFTLSNPGAKPAPITWNATAIGLRSVMPAAGALVLAPGARSPITVTITAGTTPDLYRVAIHARDNNAALQSASHAIRVTHPGEVLPLAWIANRFDNSVMPYDPRTNVLGSEVAVKGGPRDGALTPDNRRFFVADRDAKTVSVVDTARGAVIANIAVGNSPNGTAITRDGKTVWIANYDDGTIQSIDTTTLHASAPIAVGAGPRFIAIAPDDKTLYVSDQAANEVTPVDITTRTTLAPIAQNCAHPTGLSIASDGATLYVTCNTGSEALALAIPSGRLIATIPTGVEPQMIAIQPGGTTALILNNASNTANVIDPRTNATIGVVTVGGQPFDAEWADNGAYAIIINRRDNDLVRFTPNAPLGKPLFLGEGGAYTISMPHE